MIQLLAIRLLAYAKVKPHKVIEAMREFSKERYQVDVLKVEVPVNMRFVEGYGQETCYSQAEASRISMNNRK